MHTWWSGERLETRRIGGVMPLPLMFETNWALDGWEVNVILVTAVEPGGYTSSNPIWTYRQPYADLGAGSDEAQRVTHAATIAFGDRLRAVLADSLLAAVD